MSEGLIDHIRARGATSNIFCLLAWTAGVVLHAVMSGALTKKQIREKRGWFLFMAGYFTAGYMLINRVSAARSSFYDVSLGFEHKIPFMPEFIFGYLVVYLSVVMAYVVIDDMADWMRTVRSFLISTTISYAFFLALPVRMDMRPELVAGSGISEWATRLYYIVDLPYNCFPSLHVTYPVLATMLVWGTKRNWRWAFLAMAAVVSVSVVLVKQHYIADVVAGAANAAAGYWLALLYERYFLTRKEVTQTQEAE